MEIRYQEEGLCETADFATFKDNHPHATVLSVDGQDCIGLCEGCNKPIVEGDAFQQWIGSIITCEECSDQDKLVLCDPT